MLETPCGQCRNRGRDDDRLRISEVWYDGPRGKLDRLSWQTLYNEPVVIIEIVAEARARNHADEDTAEPV